MLNKFNSIIIFCIFTLIKLRSCRQMENPFKWLLNQKPKNIEVPNARQSDSASECSSPTLSDRSSPAKQLKLPRFIGSKMRPPLFWFLIIFLTSHLFHNLSSNISYFSMQKWQFQVWKLNPTLIGTLKTISPNKIH
jgi:hypothetical protein